MVLIGVLAFGTTRTAAAAEPPAATGASWPDTPPPPPPAPRVVTGPRVSHDAAVRDLLRNDSTIARQYRRGRGMIIGGSVALGGAGATLFVAGLSALGDGLAAVDAEEPDPGPNHVTRGLVVTSCVLFAAGIPLIIVGAQQRSAAIHQARRRVAFGGGRHGFGLRF